jgi:ABC-type transporter Mla subunit MlaD
MLSIFLMLFLVWPGCALFDPNLKLKVMFDDQKGLKEEADVVYAYRNQVIGKVTKIEKLQGKDVIAHLDIESDFKGLVRTGALFVIETPLFKEKAPARVLMDVLPKDMDNPPIESGSLIKGVSWAYYQMAISAAAVGPAIESILQQSKRFLKEIEDVINSEEFDRLVEEIKKESERIAQLTEQQKKKFQEEILPELEKQVDEALKRLEMGQKEEDKKNLQREFEGLKKELKE